MHNWKSFKTPYLQTKTSTDQMGWQFVENAEISFGLGYQKSSRL